MNQLPTWKISISKNPENEAWWQHAIELYSVMPESVPEAIHPLLDSQWEETEVVATRTEVKYAQAWATGISGWNPKNGGLIFKRI